MQYSIRLIVALSTLVIGYSAEHAVAQTPGDATSKELKLFAVEVRVGPNWDASKAPSEQVFFKEHSANLKSLRDAGHIVMGARYSDKGLIIFSARSIEDVKVLMEQDPSLDAGTFVYEVHAFSVFYPGMVQTGSGQ